MVSLWQHEVTRVVKDRICRSVDIKWFEKTLKTIIKEVQYLRKKHILGFFYLSSFSQNDMTVVPHRLSFNLFQNFPELPANSPSPLFITFPLDTGLYAQRPVTQGRVVPKVCLSF